MSSFTLAGSTALAVIALLGSAGWARADLLTYYFEGHVTQIHESIAFDDSVHIGAPFVGSYTFDPTGVTDVFPSTPNVGFYRFPAPAHMSARIGNYDFVTSDLGILIWNDQLSGDLYEPISNGGFVAAGYQWETMSVYLGDRAGMALDSDALPLGVPELDAFPHDRALLIEFPGGELGIRGRLTSLIPEPGSLVLLSLGAAGVICRRSRR